MYILFVKESDVLNVQQLDSEAAIPEAALWDALGQWMGNEALMVDETAFITHATIRQNMGHPRNSDSIVLVAYVTSGNQDKRIEITLPKWPVGYPPNA